jgi:hypothetical protein
MHCEQLLSLPTAMGASSQLIFRRRRTTTGSSRAQYYQKQEKPSAGPGFREL